MKKYRANYGTIVEEFEIIRETDKTIIYIDRNNREVRDYKKSNWSSWHDTKEDAINYLINKREIEIQSSLNKIEYLKAEIEKIKNL